MPLDGDGELSLNLTGIRWRRWSALCEELAAYLHPGAPPYDGADAVLVERLLEETGYFELALCEIGAAGSRIECALTPQPIIREISIGGDIPLGLLVEELRRRLLAEPGTLILNEPAMIAEQRERLRSFLERDGFFEAEVAIETVAMGDAEPNLGMRLDVEISGWRTARLGDVEVEGDHPLERREVEGRLRRFGLLWFFERRFRPDRFFDDMDELTLDLQGEGWPEARVTGSWRLDPSEDLVDVVLRIDTGPRLTLAFFGNAALRDRDLAERATFAEVGIVDPTELARTEAAMRRAYQEAGYPFARVESDTRQPDERTIAIVFMVEEGERARVRRVHFEGNETLTRREIRREADVQTRRSRFLAPGRWIDEVVEADAASIGSVYAERGFGAAGVEAERLIRQDGDIEVTFRIEEGPRRTVRTMRVIGVPDDIDEEGLVSRLALRPGEPFVEGRAREDRNEILATLATTGYPFASVLEIVDAPSATEGGEVDVEYFVYPGTPALMGGLLIRGNFRTRSALIEEQLRLSLGEPLDLAILGDSRRRLRALGAFTSVELEPLGLWRGEQETWQMVAVQEATARTADVVGSYSTDEGFTVGGNYRDRNLLGRAINLDLRVRLGDAFGRIHPALRIGRTDRIDGDVRAPRPFGAPFDADASLFFRLEDQPAFFLERLGAGAGISRQLLSRETCRACPDIIGQLRYELTASRFELRDDEQVALDPARPFQTAPRENVGRIAPLLLLDRRDSFVDPTRGWSGDVRLELAQWWLSPLAEGHGFWRAITNARGYLNLGTPWERPIGGGRLLGGPLVLAARSGFGVARPLGREPGLPDAEALYYGGDFSVRGVEPFASAVAFPGANYRLDGGIELRWYAARNIFFGSIQLAGFVDFATVSYGLGDIFEHPVVTTGPLVRYVTPVGPLSLGWGFPIVRPAPIVAVRPAAVPERGRLHLTFGYAF